MLIIIYSLHRNGRWKRNYQNRKRKKIKMAGHILNILLQLFHMHMDKYWFSKLHKQKEEFSFCWRASTAAAWMGRFFWNVDSSIRASQYNRPIKLEARRNIFTFRQVCAVWTDGGDGELMIKMFVSTMKLKLNSLALTSFFHISYGNSSVASRYLHIYIRIFDAHSERKSKRAPSSSSSSFVQECFAQSSQRTFVSQQRDNVSSTSSCTSSSTFAYKVPAMRPKHAWCLEYAI